MRHPFRASWAIAPGLSAALSLLSACGVADRSAAAASSSTTGPITYASYAADPLGSYALTGDVQPIHDPSIIRQGSTYYLFTTDVIGLPPANFLPIRCSEDKQNWRMCGSIFPDAIPAWVRAKVPGILGIWAPDISYFNGEYHVYYSGSTLNSNRSVIGLVTNVTLDPADPNYKWVDHGMVLESVPSSDFNAIDPNIVIDAGHRIWISYGSYWTGIKQQEINPSTGMLMPGSKRLSLATRPVVNNPIEGASIIHHGDFYYLFVSMDYCCNQDIATDNYKEAIGRSTRPNGPFVDRSGTPMMKGGGTIIVAKNDTWNAAAGGTAYVDPATGESLFVFHALKMTENGAMYLWVKALRWEDDWPVLE